MTISTQTQRAITPLIRGMATAGTLPKTEANAVCSLLQEASTPRKKTATKPKDIMLTSAQAASRLGICVKSILRMYADGKIRGVKLTGSHKSLRFPESEIERFVNGEV
jgi:excisionase family DNA binding protein